LGAARRFGFGFARFGFARAFAFGRGLLFTRTGARFVDCLGCFDLTEG
jgi:hypothetical protein